MGPVNSESAGLVNISQESGRVFQCLQTQVATGTALSVFCLALSEVLSPHAEFPFHSSLDILPSYSSRLDIKLGEYS